jgi:hypothetical protein
LPSIFIVSALSLPPFTCIRWRLVGPCS